MQGAPLKRRCCPTTSISVLNPCLPLLWLDDCAAKSEERLVLCHLPITSNHLPVTFVFSLSRCLSLSLSLHLSPSLSLSLAASPSLPVSLSHTHTKAVIWRPPRSRMGTWGGDGAGRRAPDRGGVRGCAGILRTEPRSAKMIGTNVTQHFTLSPSHPHTLTPSHPHTLTPSHPHTLTPSSSHPHTPRTGA